MWKNKTSCYVRFSRFTLRFDRTEQVCYKISDKHKYQGICALSYRTKNANLFSSHICLNFHFNKMLVFLTTDEQTWFVNRACQTLVHFAPTRSVWQTQFSVSFSRSMYTFSNKTENQQACSLTQPHIRSIKHAWLTYHVCSSVASPIHIIKLYL